MAEREFCDLCGKPCETIRVDVGNYEEYWGSQVWRAEWDTTSECCGSDVMDEDKYKDWIIEDAKLLELGKLGPELSKTLASNIRWLLEE